MALRQAAEPWTVCLASDGGWRGGAERGTDVICWKRSTGEVRNTPGDRRARARTDRHSAQPDHCSGELDEGEEVNGPSVVSCCEAPEVLEAIEAAFDAVAVLVEGDVVGYRDSSGAV